MITPEIVMYVAAYVLWSYILNLIILNTTRCLLINLGQRTTPYELNDLRTTNIALWWFSPFTLPVACVVFLIFLFIQLLIWVFNGAFHLFVFLAKLKTDIEDHLFPYV